MKGLEIILAGGTGGLGAASARMLAAEGAKLTLSYLVNRERAQPLDALGPLVQANLGIAGDRKRLLEAAPNLYGLVVFAGAPSRVKSEEDLATAAEQSLLVNYLGPVMLAREAAFRMKAVGMAGSIVLFSTMQVVRIFSGSTAYGAAKAALQQAALILAKEVRGDGIRVNVVAPGVTEAGMAEASIASGKYNYLLETEMARRFGRAEDVARAVRFFLEPDNYITGQILSVDGGATL